MTRIRPNNTNKILLNFLFAVFAFIPFYLWFNDFMHKIDCIALDGSIRRVPADQIILRPAADAPILHQKRILVLQMKHSGKYHLPAGGIDTDERLADGLAREVGEETSLEIEIGWIDFGSLRPDQFQPAGEKSWTTAAISPSDRMCSTHPI